MKSFKSSFDFFIIILLMIFISSPCFCKDLQTYDIKLSKDFHAVVKTEGIIIKESETDIPENSKSQNKADNSDTEHESRQKQNLIKAQINVFHTPSNTCFITVDCNELCLDSDKKEKADRPGQSSNTDFFRVKYNDQSHVLYGDFNFDGYYDLAVQDGCSSYGHNPSYKIYLAEKNGIQQKNNKPDAPWAAKPLPGSIQFVFNPDFTKLAHEYSGMFNYNSIVKRLYTTIRKGEKWYKYSEFEVKDNKPVPAKISLEEIDYPFMTVTTTDYSGDKPVKTVEKRVLGDQKKLTSILEFDLEDDKGKIIIFIDSSKQLKYCKMSVENKTEISWPEKKTDKSDFEFYQKNSRALLAFKIENIKYEILVQKSSDNSIFAGMMIRDNGKYSNVKAVIDSVKGSLDKLNELKPLNVEFK